MTVAGGLATAAREEVAAALAAALSVAVHPIAPPTLGTPCVVLMPDGFTPTTLAPRLAYRVRLRAVVLTDARDAAAGIAAGEELVDGVLAGLPAGVVVTEVSPPAVENLGGQGTAYSHSVSMEVLVREEPHP